MIRRAFGGVACAALVLATLLVQAEVSVREDEESLRFVKDGVVFAEMARPDAREVALKVSCSGEFVRFNLAPAAGAARTMRTLALPEIRLMEKLHAARTVSRGACRSWISDGKACPTDRDAFGRLRCQTKAGGRYRIEAQRE